MIDRRCAVVLNFTANSYHWGCYGTAMEIYLSLVERGYYVTWLGVGHTHNLDPAPASLRDYDDPDFVLNFFRRNRVIYSALAEADVVVVNGEGTLHRLRPGSQNLLFLMRAAYKFLGKPVHLINHSCFPSGDGGANDAADILYGGALRPAARVVARETASLEQLRRLGVTAHQGFDCLPRFIARHGVRRGSCGGGVLLAGGAELPDPAAHRLAALAGRHGPLSFLTGAKGEPAGEDVATVAAMRAAAPGMTVTAASSMAEWLAAIAGASCVASGRFHYTLAAAALGVPVVTLPGDTPKLDSVCAMLGLPAPIPFDAPDFDARVSAELQAALDGRGGTGDPATLAAVFSLAEENFVGL